jgi:hypothetical protein
MEENMDSHAPTGRTARNDESSIFDDGSHGEIFFWSTRPYPSLGPTERISLPNLSTKNFRKKSKTGILLCSNKFRIFMEAPSRRVRTTHQADGSTPFSQQRSNHQKLRN